MYCENVRVNAIQEALDGFLVQPSPCVVYSESRIRENIGAYVHALEKADIPCVLGYAIKANFNPAVLAVMKDEGCAAVAVSGNELKLALQVGISPEQIIFNGNGKQRWELELAVKSGCLINVDSRCDLRHIVQEATRQRKATSVFVRLNPDIDSVSGRIS